MGKPKTPNINKKHFHLHDLTKIRPLTDNQEHLFEQWEEYPDISFFLYGSAGTGKTFTAMYMALHDVLSKDNPYDNLLIIRSTVPSRDIGFLPGDLDEKIEVYEEPYMSICDELFPHKKSYEYMKEKGLIHFCSTSFLRGTTFDNTVILVDETQNMSWIELYTILTRMGNNSKIMFCGDLKQNDLVKNSRDVSGLKRFMDVIETMENYFEIVEFLPDDIVRSGIVKEFILKCENLENNS